LIRNGKRVSASKFFTTESQRAQRKTWALGNGLWAYKNSTTLLFLSSGHAEAWCPEERGIHHPPPAPPVKGGE